MHQLLHYLCLRVYTQKHRRSKRTAFTYITMKPAMFVNTTSSSGEDAKLTVSTWCMSASPANSVHHSWLAYFSNINCILLSDIYVNCIVHRSVHLWHSDSMGLKQIFKCWQPLPTSSKSSKLQKIKICYSMIWLTCDHQCHTHTHTSHMLLYIMNTYLVEREQACSYCPGQPYQVEAWSWEELVLKWHNGNINL